MNARKRLLEQHLHTLNALLRGGISRGFNRVGERDDLQNSLREQWETQRNLLRRVLAEPGDPADRLLEWRERTQGFMDKYPERSGWTDREGQEWRALVVLEAIDKLLEEIENWELEDESFEETEEEE